MLGNDAFFKESYKAGFRKVIGTFRHNMLAGFISAYELNHRDKAVPANADLAIESISNSTRMWNNAWQAAIDAGMDMHYYSFVNITTGFCGAMGEVVEHIGCHGGGFRYSCMEVDAHQASSNHELTMVERIGLEPTKKITKWIRGTPYAWMLDLSAKSWPKNVPRRLEDTPIPER